MNVVVERGDGQLAEVKADQVRVTQAGCYERGPFCQD